MAALGPDRAAAAVVSPETVTAAARATHDHEEDETMLDDDDDDDGNVDDDAAATSPEEEAVDFLERVLGEVFQDQGPSDENLGNSLDEEWSYIEKYRSGTTSD